MLGCGGRDESKANPVALKMMPAELKWDANATPPQFTNTEDMSIEKGTQVRVKLVGIRSEVGEMWAVGSIREDYLGYVFGQFFPSRRLTRWCSRCLQENY
jgi:hypothetical protein